METPITKQTATLEDWYARYREPIARYIAGKFQDRYLVEDLTQETFIRAWGTISRKGEIDHVQAYLYRIATNLCVDQSRRRQVITWQSLELNDHDTQCFVPDPQAAYGTREQIRQALDDLPAQYCSALLLRFQEGYSNEGRRSCSLSHLAVLDEINNVSSYCCNSGIT